MYFVGNASENRFWAEISLTKEKLKELGKHHSIIRDPFLPLGDDIAFEDNIRELIRRGELDLHSQLKTTSHKKETGSGKLQWSPIGMKILRRCAKIGVFFFCYQKLEYQGLSRRLFCQL